MPLPGAQPRLPLDHPALEACLDRLQALGLPVVLTWQLEDTRMQGTAMQVPTSTPRRWPPWPPAGPACAWC